LTACRQDPHPALYATAIRNLAFAATGQQRHMRRACCTAAIHIEVFMFSLISLYFASRRDVVVAERYIAGLVDAPAKAADAPVSATTAATEAKPLPLAA
jgi:hypothetical protein